MTSKSPASKSPASKSTASKPPASREILQQERIRIEQLKETLATDQIAQSVDADSVSEFSGQNQHPADVGSDAFERTKDLSILASLDDQLREVDRALERVERGTYGVCEACGDPILGARLEALPATRFCVQDQAAAERQLSA